MKHRAFWILLLGACGAEAPPEEPTVPPMTAEAAASPGATRCSSCRRPGGPKHACARTRWCGSCGRDAGTLHHRCGKTQFCANCSRETGTGHVCGMTEVCSTRVCLRDGQVLEAGPHHVCGHTRVCAKCQTDAALEGHSCRDRTRFCPRCLEDVTASHLCGLSAYCKDCRAERAQGHRHEDKTRFCPQCRGDKAFTHRH